MNISNLNSKYIFIIRTIFHCSLSNLYKIKFKFLLFLLQFIFSYSFIVIARYSDIQKKFLHFQYLNVEDDFSQGTILSVFQDSRGFFWFATQYGLNRYDGYSFKIYTCNFPDTLSISYNFILSVAEDKLGNLWVGTFSKSVYYG